MPSVVLWAKRSPQRYQCSTASQGVIRLLLSLERGKSRFGKHGVPITEVTDAFNFIVEHPHAQITVDCQEFQMLERFTVVIYDKTSPLVSVNEARRNCSARKTERWRTFPQLNRPCCSTPSVQCTRLASGQPVTRPNNRHQLLKAAVGHWMQKQSPGFLSGARSLRQQRL
ncbi:hypothetical protein GWK47_008538 [Chionoecetes opilio]|uniref:Uncharacterized protein n=1 Tax=Chionoecetes opilio TaxID=41210 RepID=A0A8J4Y3N1_CHIOP|nr:hypothetical protein GWK47_008538 [Chionoecetes opilio]